jgi:hypothetical protein
MKKLTLFISIIFIVSIIWGQSASQNCKPTNTMTENQICSQIIESLQLCTKNITSKLKLQQNIAADFTLKNLSDKTIEIPRGRFENTYTIKVFDPKGNQLLSKLETLEKKVNEGKAQMEELIANLPIYSSPASTIILPKQEIPIEFNLSQYYDFTEKGKYKIEISMRLQKKNDTAVAFLTTGAIEIEIE